MPEVLNRFRARRRRL